MLNNVPTLLLNNGDNDNSCLLGNAHYLPDPMLNLLYTSTFRDWTNSVN